MAIPPIRYREALTEVNQRRILGVNEIYEKNPFLMALHSAHEAEASHYQRQEKATRRWFESHPENRHDLFEIDWRDVQLRLEGVVDVELRFGKGWWERVTDDAWIGLPQERGENHRWHWALPDEAEYVEAEKPVQLELALAA